MSYVVPVKILACGRQADHLKQATAISISLQVARWVGGCGIQESICVCVSADVFGRSNSTNMAWSGDCCHRRDTRCKKTFMGCWMSDSVQVWGGVLAKSHQGVSYSVVYDRELASSQANRRIRAYSSEQACGEWVQIAH